MLGRPSRPQRLDTTGIAVITAAQLSAGGERSLNIQGQAFHSHGDSHGPADDADRCGLPDVPGILQEPSL